MPVGTWFVLCDRARAIALDHLAWQIAPLRNAVVECSDETLRVSVCDRHAGHDAEIRVGLSIEPHVVNESTEIAEFHGRTAATGRRSRPPMRAARSHGIPSSATRLTTRSS